MKIALWTMIGAVGLALVGCGGGGDNSTAMSGTGSSGGGSGSGPIGPSSSDFVAFVNNQVLMQPAFGSSAPTATSTLTTDFALGEAGVFSYIFTAGDTLPTGTYQASVACTQAGLTKCNPGISADLNSSVN
jgi:hypothetical protein